MANSTCTLADASYDQPREVGTPPGCGRRHPWPGGAWNKPLHVILPQSTRYAWPQYAELQLTCQEG